MQPEPEEEETLRDPRPPNIKHKTNRSWNNLRLEKVVDNEPLLQSEVNQTETNTGLVIIEPRASVKQHYHVRVAKSCGNPQRQPLRDIHI